LTVRAAETEVTWAGVAFISDKEPAKLYPNLLNIGHEKLNTWALKALKSNERIREFKNFKIKTDNNGNPLSVGINESQGVLMSVVLFAEDTFFGKDISAKGRETFDNTFQIYGSLVFFEFETGSYVNSIPLILDRTFGGEEGIPDSKTISDRFKKMLDGSYSENFFDEIFNRAGDIKINEMPDKFAKFGEVKFGQTVNDFFAKTGEVDSWKLRINKQYENVFSLNTQIPMVPSGPNTEINSFTAVFLNGSQKIELPDPFYIFDANVAIFKRFEQKSERNTYKTICHFVAIRLNFKIKEDDGPDEVVMIIPFLRSKDSCGNVVINNVVDPSYYFPMNMLALISNIGRQFKTIDKNYLNKVLKGKKLEDAINEINKVKAEFNE
jgi:hypothetical protein